MVENLQFFQAVILTQRKMVGIAEVIRSYRNLLCLLVFAQVQEVFKFQLLRRHIDLGAIDREVKRVFFYIVPPIG